MKRTTGPVLGIVVGMIAALIGAGCGGNGGSSSQRLAEASENTEATLRDLMLGIPPERAATRLKVDPPILTPGGRDTLLVATDAEAFSRAAGGAVSVSDVRKFEQGVVSRLDKSLQKRGFRARVVAFGGVPTPPNERAALASLTPATESAGSPKEKAEGKGQTIILIRLKITDTRTGELLTEQQYYSGITVRAR